MATLYYKIKAFLGREPTRTEIGLQNNSDGVGDYIAEWNVDGIAKPTLEALEAYNSQADVFQSDVETTIKRVREYGSWREQLDKLYHDMLDSKLDSTGEFAKHIKSVKDTNPKS